MPGLGSGAAAEDSFDGDPVTDEELDEVPVCGAWPNLLTRLSTFFGLSSWVSPELPRMEEALCGVGGGPLLLDPVDEVEGDFFMGEPVFEEDEVGGGGKSPREVSTGGGGNSGDCGAMTPPGCHFGLALTAGGD